MADIVRPTFNPFAHVPVDRVLNGALEAGLEDVFVLGSGENMAAYHASSTSDVGKMLLMLERARHAVMQQDPTRQG